MILVDTFNPGDFDPLIVLVIVTTVIRTVVVILNGLTFAPTRKGVADARLLSMPVLLSVVNRLPVLAPVPLRGTLSVILSVMISVPAIVVVVRLQIVPVVSVQVIAVLAVLAIGLKIVD